jgi:hypothetical protein
MIPKRHVQVLLTAHRRLHAQGCACGAQKQVQWVKNNNKKTFSSPTGTKRLLITLSVVPPAFRILLHDQGKGTKSLSMQPKDALVLDL